MYFIVLAVQQQLCMCVFHQRYCYLHGIAGVQKAGQQLCGVQCRFATVIDAELCMSLSAKPAARCACLSIGLYCAVWCAAMQQTVAAVLSACRH
jgi:hypothetical protein